MHHRGEIDLQIVFSSKFNFDLRRFNTPSFYMNVGHFSEYSGHPNNKFQTFLKNSRVQVGVYLRYTKICIFQSRFCTIFFQNFLFSIPWKIHEKPLSFCQPFYWPWIFNLHFSLEPGIVEACNMAHLNPVSLKINLVGWNPPFMPLSWSKCEKPNFFSTFPDGGPGVLG